LERGIAISISGFINRLEELNHFPVKPIRLFNKKTVTTTVEKAKAGGRKKFL